MGELIGHTDEGILRELAKIYNVNAKIIVSTMSMMAALGKDPHLALEDLHRLNGYIIDFLAGPTGAKGVEEGEGPEGN